MMQITTDRGLTYDVDFAYAPTYDGTCMVQMQDNRLLSVIAPEFDGIKSIHAIDPNVGESDYVGYSLLASISRIASGAVLIKMRKNDLGL